MTSVAACVSLNMFHGERRYTVALRLLRATLLPRFLDVFDLYAVERWSLGSTAISATGGSIRATRRLDQLEQRTTVLLVALESSFFSDYRRHVGILIVY
jgi:hypothetical protein